MARFSRDMKRLVFLLALAAVVATFVYALTREQTLASPLVGHPAPAWSIPLYAADSTLSLQELRGRPVVMNFWASWCLSCRDEARVLESGWRRYGPGVAFVGVAVADEAAPARAFIERYGKTYHLGPDLDGSMALDYGLFGVPETFFISPDGRILSKHVGPLTDAELERRIAELKAGVVGGAGGDPSGMERLPGGVGLPDRLVPATDPEGGS
ncbi:MAG: redoxin domain-containing protein [Gemmatimonadetes bacterium]|nr:redoxin domain-containing protein [Gemmatimonadota bacterium]